MVFDRCWYEPLSTDFVDSTMEYAFTNWLKKIQNSVGFFSFSFLQTGHIVTKKRLNNFNNFLNISQQRTDIQAL